MPDDESLAVTTGTVPAVTPAATNAVELLTEDVRYTGWEHSIAQKKSFYVRGATWFHNHVMRPISDIQKRPKEDFGVIFGRLPQFRELSLDWDEIFSPRQAMAALSLRQRQPVKFHKAVQTILLCDQIVRELVAKGQSSVQPDDALRRMRIEPAVFYVQDFDSDQLAEFKKHEPQVLERLRSETNQRTRVVFAQMADGHTVSRDLADKTRNALQTMFSATEIGAVDHRNRPGIAAAAAPTEALPD